MPLVIAAETTVKGVATVEASALLRELASAHPGVEVWPDEGFTEDGSSYVWVVSRFGGGNVRNPACAGHGRVGFSVAPYNEAGDDLWAAAG